jgi:predicted amidohydrolase
MEQKKEVKISILQMSSVLGDVEANISKVDKLIQNNLPNNSDVLVLPEVWTVGWACRFFQNSAQELHKGSGSEFLSSVAKKYNINIIGGSFITKQGENYYNTCPVFDRSGRLVASYNKNHLYSYYGCEEGTFVTSGDNGVMVSLDGVNYGLTICYDIRFPELYRAYMKSGADVLVNCAAWGSKKPVPWEVMTKSRAVENQCYMVALTQSGYIENDEYNLGQSRIIDFKGDEVASIMSGEGIATGEISLDLMYDFRAKAPTLNDIKEDYEVKILCEKY